MKKNYDDKNYALKRKSLPNKSIILKFKPPSKNIKIYLID
jgi:hypothetical protein